MWRRKVASQKKKAFEWYLIGVYIVHFSKKTFFVKKEKKNQQSAVKVIRHKWGKLQKNKVCIHRKKWYFVTKIVGTYCEKKMFW